MAWSDDDRYTVSITPAAERDLDELDDPVRQEAMETLAALEEDPFPAGSVLMRGYTNLYRIKFYREAYRIVYTISKKQQRVIIERVRPRGTVYIGLRDPDRS